MHQKEDFDVRGALLDWYQENRRDLPWRRPKDPYRVLVSEVMLQQTQVERVAAYFESFVERFSTFEALAAGPRADVIRLWAGLGYNRRAVQLHELARIVVERHGGVLPSDRQALLALPGIGPYTAGAILSMGFGRAEPALDTNVRRVIGRYVFGPDAAAGPGSRTRLTEAARRLLPVGRAGEWNQALMDLGSSVCVSRRPRCLICPIQLGCSSAGRASARAQPRERPAGSLFVGSSRYYRGRLLAQLRALPAGSSAPLAEVAGQLARRGVAEPRCGWASVGEELERDGLARVERTTADVAVGLA